MDKLQHVQNAAACLVNGTRKYERGLSWLMHNDLRWLVIPQHVPYKLAVTVHRCLRHWAPRYLADYCVPVSEVAGRDLPDVINCQFREFAAAPLGPVHFLSPEQESRIHCLIICGIQLLTPNNLSETWRRICSLEALAHWRCYVIALFTYLLALVLRHQSQCVGVKHDIRLHRAVLYNSVFQKNTGLLKQVGVTSSK